MAKNQNVAVLANGTEVRTTKDGWSETESARLPVLLEGWQEGKASHHPISLGLALACKDIIPGAYKGDFQAQTQDGETVLIPVIDPLVIHEAMMDAFVEAYKLDVQRVRIATSRASVTKELAEAGANEDVIAALRANGFDKLADRLQKAAK